MNTRGARIFRMFAAVMAVTPVLLAQQPPPGGQLARIVAEAKAAGKTETSLVTMSEPIHYGPLERFDQKKSVWVVKVDPRPPQAAATPHSIYTWRLLRVTKRITTSQTRAPGGCDVPYPASWTAPADDTIAVATFGGVMTFDGVTVMVREVESLTPTLIALQSYVIVGEPCGDGVMTVEQEFPLAGNGEVLTPTGRPLMTPALTLEGLERLLRR
jgi:hypothetical protein